MRGLFVVWLAWCCFVPVAVHAAEDERFTSVPNLLAWIDGYRQAPVPEDLPAAVHAMARLGLFTGQEQAAFYIGFMAGVLGHNQLKAESLVGRMFPMPPERQAPIIKAIAFSGLPEWKDLLRRNAERMPARKVLIDAYLHHGKKTLLELPLDAEPNLLDTLWGYYYATGYNEPVLRIMTALKWADEKKHLERLTIGGMASLTLAQNGARNQALLDLYHVQKDHQRPEVSRELGEIINAIEMFDADRIRKKAIASIEALKRNPVPDGGESWSAWKRQAGATALALGCVAANVTGHFEIGAACVISGALYSGASRLIETYPE